MFSLINTAYAAEESGISVHLDPYIVGYFGSMPITATLLTAWLTMFILVVLAYVIGRKPQLIPNKLQSFFEMIVGGIYDYMAETLESKMLARKYFPIVATIFFFVLFMNWLGLFPGVTSIGYYDSENHFIPFLYPPATDLNITIAFAIISFVVVEFAGIAALGVWKYGAKFINFSSPLAFAIGLIELISEIARLIAFSFRLFGNIFAGKTLLVVAMALATPYVLPVPIIAYEVFVGFIQAFIFAVLTLFFIKIAVTEAEH